MRQNIVLVFAVATAAVAFVEAKNYVYEKVEVLNGKRYVSRYNQPFFRVYHPPHHKNAREDPPEDIGEDSQSGTVGHPHHNIMGPQRGPPPKKSGKKKPPKFGHHNLPEEDPKDFIEPRWPVDLEKYAHCLDIPCTCPYYEGRVVNNTCVLPSGKVLGKAIRKDYRTYTPDEKRQFEEALHRMKSSGVYGDIGRVHKYAGVHSGPGFFPWHREFIKRLEIAFRKFYPDLGLPYWDSTLDNNLPEPKDSVTFSDYLLGDTNKDGYVVTGAWANWTTLEGRTAFQRLLADEPDGEFFNDARINWVLDQPELKYVMAYSLPLHGCINYTLDDRFLEYSHDYTHYYISGDMYERFSSNNDPIFFMHHGFVDSIWELWRQQRQTRAEREEQYPEDNPECEPPWHFKYQPMALLSPYRNIDALSNKYTDNMFEYAPRPTCTSLDPNCRSEYLFCDLITNDDPKCSTKVKIGGNCTGFERIEDACYKGKCVDGTCVADPETKKVEKRHDGYM
ncbi:hypothetical protein QR680_007861 [Steinernema hermaphroditum]|uniref:Tyrosinase copper-binding domain-containing protein n=1 Tax=Steinernema hermaphroditum TaxID=289476 RepID=A0AA39M604_9BILA|nr:hypothetical protein QR680_007861 [Steinernema hermaphroditum]